MYRLLSYLIFLVYMAVIFGLLQCTSTQEKYSPVPVEYTVIHVLNEELKDEVYTTTTRTMSFQPCSADIECYEMCIENGGDPDWCEESLMKGDTNEESKDQNSRR